MSLLAVESVSKHFGGLTALNEVSFTLTQGEILSVIGPNGAGKSTLFRVITHVYPPSKGRIRLAGENITGLAPHRVAQRGIVRTFQENVSFQDMTPLEAVILAHHQHCQANGIEMVLQLRRSRWEEARFRENSERILDLMGLAAVAQEPAKGLPHGSLRALGVALALAAQPKILLLDEPFAGLNPEETDVGIQRIREIQQQGITVVLVEHDMRAVMTISDRILVLNFGTQIALGSPVEIQRNEKVIEAYLGIEDEGLGV